MVVDAPDRVRAFLPEVLELVGDAGLVTLEDVEVLRGQTT